MTNETTPSSKAGTSRFSSLYGVPVVLLVLALLGGIAYYEVRLRGRLPETEPLPPIVRVVEITPAPEFDTKSYPGVAKESQVANLSFRVAGKLVESQILVGARVEEGAMIARLDPRDYELAVQRLETELQAAEALFSAMKTGARSEDIASLEAQHTAAVSQMETAETNFKRFTALLADQVASQAQYDLAKTQYDTAKGQKEALDGQLDKARRGSRQEEIEAMEARILGLKAGLETARNALDDTVLRAPFDGFVVEKFVEDHEVVAPGVPVVSYVTASVIDVAVSLPEEIVVRMGDIRAYRVEFESWPGMPYPAKLKELGRAIQRGKQTYPLQVRIELSDEESKKHPVFPGMTAMVQIDLARPDGDSPRMLPLAALFGEDKDTAVWVVEGDTLHRRSVELLRIVDGCAEVRGDLRQGEKIVAAGARSLRENQRVRLEKPATGSR